MLSLNHHKQLQAGTKLTLDDIDILTGGPLPDDKENAPSPG